MRKTSLLASLCVFVISACALGVGGDMGLGTEPLTDGSETYPWLIEDLVDFDTFANPNNAATYWAAGVHTQLMTDIDLAGRTYTTAVIAPDTSTDYGFQGTVFTGSFNGNTFSISNLLVEGHSIGAFAGNYLGFFGKIGNGGMISNVDLINASILGRDYIGGLVGLQDHNSILYNCSCIGNIIAVHSHSDCLGVLAGRSNGEIINCSSSGRVEGNTSSFYIGGLVGFFNGSSIINCYSSAKTNGNLYSGRIGGLVGSCHSGVVERCYSTGLVSCGEGTDILGGLIGFNESSVVECYSTSPVIGSNNSSWVGGLVGYNYSVGKIEDCYAEGNIFGYSKVGGLVGGNEGWVEEIYFDPDEPPDIIEHSAEIYSSYSLGTVQGVLLYGGHIGDDIAPSTIGCCNYFLDTAGPDNGYGTPLDDTNMMIREDCPRLAWQEVFAGDIAGLYGADMVDFAYLSQYWGLTGCDSGTDCGRADIDGSGDVGLGDLVYVAEDWLKQF
jgi:hypothetical protein